MLHNAKTKQITFKSRFKSIEEAEKFLTNIDKYITRKLKGSNEANDHFVFVGLSYMYKKQRLFKRIAKNHYNCKHEFYLLPKDEIKPSRICLDIFYSHAVNPEIGSTIIKYIRKNWGDIPIRRKDMDDVKMCDIMTCAFRKRPFVKMTNISFKDYKIIMLDNILKLKHKAQGKESEATRILRAITPKRTYKNNEENISQKKYEEKILSEIPCILERYLQNFKENNKPLPKPFVDMISVINSSEYIKLLIPKYTIIKDKKKRPVTKPCPIVAYYKGTIEDFRKLNLKKFKQAKYAVEKDNDLEEIKSKLNSK